MGRHRQAAWIAGIALLGLVSCTSSYKTVFLNQTYRANLSLEDEELKQLQFYISTNVLLQYEGPAGKQSIFLQEETPGVVTAVGPDWLKVSFRQGGADVPFVVDSQGQYDMYSVATELPGQTGFHMLKDLRHKVFYSTMARLMRSFMATRPISKSRRKRCSSC
jgi:hypothetical protein